MIIINWPKVAHNAITFVQLQTFLTLIYLPILVAWGLPISVASPLGNLIFSPILTVFLLLSSLIFFAELLYIPNDWLLVALKWVNNGWITILNINTPHAMIGFIKPPLIILYGIGVCSFIIMHIRYPNWRLHSTIASTLFLCAVICGLKYAQPHPAPHTQIIRTAKGAHSTVQCIHTHNTTVIIDVGAIGKTISAPTWVAYTLVPEMVKHTGSLTIDHLIALKPSSMLFEALTTLCTKVTIKNLYLPYWSGMLPKNVWRKFAVLCETLKEHGVNVVRLGGKEMEEIGYEIAGDVGVKIVDTGKWGRYKEVEYPIFKITCENLEILEKIY